MTALDVASLRREFPGRRIDYYPSIDSTMHVASNLPPGSVVLADEQRAGMGRHGHAWNSEAGSGIYCSIVLDPAPLLTLALGLAVADAIARSTGVACDLRWPNDVMIGSRKLAGILVQLSDGVATAGIGINVNHARFPSELAAEATSLALAAGHPFAREEIVKELLRAVAAFTAYSPESILCLFTHASSYAAGRRVVVHQPDGVIEGVTAGLNPDGFLIVRKDDGTATLILAGGVRAAGS